MIVMLACLLLLASAQRGPVVPVGSVAPAFTVDDDRGTARSLADFKGKWVVLEWHEKGCPYVTKHYRSSHMQRLQKHWTDQGVSWLMITSSAIGNVQRALTDSRAGRPITPAATEPYGCSIHYAATQPEK